MKLLVLLLVFLFRLMAIGVMVGLTVVLAVGSIALPILTAITKKLAVFTLRKMEEK